MKFYMLVLALDTTTRQGSVAVTRDGQLLGTYAGDPTVTHGERLPADLMRVLTAHALRVRDVDLFAVASGPGSFTGLRIGIATQQGLALANNRPLVGISALDALNAAAISSGAVAAWIDAQRKQVFSALYEDGRVIEHPIVDTPEHILVRWTAEGIRPTLFIGDGAVTYKDVIRRRAPGARVANEVPMLAPSIARLAEEQLRERGSDPPDAIRALYVRRSDAELARDRKTPNPTSAS